MRKRFNTTGLCNPDMHWMADVSGKISEILAMVEAGDYFIINRPRQYGKTTILFLLEKKLLETGQYLPLSISFEGIDATIYQSHHKFIEIFLEKINEELIRLERRELVSLVQQEAGGTTSFFKLGQLIEKLCSLEKEIVLMIDEVDNASNNQLFLDFLGMLRNKFLERSKGRGHTFLSVILAGVHDVKTLKAKIRPDEERKFNSPWNIAAVFDTDMGLNVDEISSMLAAYSRDKKVRIDIPGAAAQIHHYTSGYPFLTSSICKLLDEKTLPAKSSETATVTPYDIEIAVTHLLKESNTNFDSLIKNLENDPELYQFIKSIAVEGEPISYHVTDNLVSLAKTYGMVAEERGNCKIHNRIYEQLIYEHMVVKMMREKKAALISRYNVSSNFTRAAGDLDFEKVLLKFQEFMKEQYSHKDGSFLERNGRLVFQAFLKPIINGHGFDFKEAQVSEERRLDIVITWGTSRYVVELKIWRGPKAHEQGLLQLRDYLDRINISRGYLVIFDPRKQKKRDWTQKTIHTGDKEIFTVLV